MNKVTIYTDGSARGNPGPGGYGTLLISGEHYKELSAGFKETTNNRMELMAAIVGIEALKKPSEVEIFSDSKYVVNAMTLGWIQGWKRFAWSKKGRHPLKNAELWRRLDQAILQGQHDITWTWVKGHAGNPYNERCDALATTAADGDDLPSDEGYVAQSQENPGLFDE